MKKKLLSALMATGLVLSSLCASAYAYDADSNESVDVFDVVKLRSYIVNGEDLSEAKLSYSDVSGDGRVDISDVVLLRACVVNGTTLNINNEKQREADIDEGLEAYADTATEANADEGLEAYADTATEANADEGLEAYADTSTDADTDTATEADTDTATEADANTTTEADTNTTEGNASATENISENQDVEEFKLEVLRLVNIEREKEGLQPLEYCKELEAPTQIRAEEIITYFAHTRPNGDPWFTLVYDYNIKWRGIGENLAAGYATPEQVVKGWMNSEGHRANIMDPTYNRMAIGYVEKADTPYQYYWAQWFAQM